MSNPTSNFGWQMPTPVDLVTDLPADFEVFGQAVDSSLADLKGGTSGQVLSKNSNTDMDFVWVTSDDANAIQNTIVDAKGDLIAASANDTPARLAVGSNGAQLVAASGETTGLKWEGQWQTWTPTWNNLTVGNGTQTARYKQIDKLVYLELRFTFGSTSSMGNYPNFTLPVAEKYGAFSGTSEYGDAGTASYVGLVQVAYGGAAILNALGTSGNYGIAAGVTTTIPFTWTTTDTITVRLQYEAA